MPRKPLKKTVETLTPGEARRFTVKAINHLGDEVMKVYRV
jgi:hypothetical protein